MVRAGNMPRALRISKKIGFAIPLKANKPVQSNRMTIDLNWIELNHQIFGISIRIDSSERLNGKAGQINAYTCFVLEKFGWAVNRRPLLLHLLCLRKLHRPGPVI